MNAKPRPAIVVFPGSNCDKDMQQIFREIFALDPIMVWHEEAHVPRDVTHIVLPGGFSYGDYLRPGALASFSPIMSSVKELASFGIPVLGVCNGFQILCEAQLLPGVLLRNHHDRFVCKVVETTFYGLRGDLVGKPLRLPIAHGQGRFYATADVLDSLKKNQQIILTYDDVDGQGAARVNGSEASIAGIVGGPQKNIIGMMPHPERSFRFDGAEILRNFLFG